MNKCIISKNKSVHSTKIINDRVMCGCGEYNISKEEFNEMKKYKLYD